MPCTIMFSDHDGICDPRWEDCLSEYSCLGQLGNLNIDCHVPVSPLDLLLLFDLLFSCFDHEFVFYDFLVYSYHVGRGPAKTCLYVFRRSIACRWRKVASYAYRLIQVFYVDDLIFVDWLYP